MRVKLDGCGVTTAYTDMTVDQVWAERRRLAALRDPAMMGRYLDPQHFRVRAHTRFIASQLAQVRAGGIDRLLLTTPPQVGKSTVASELFPFWWLAKHPRDRVLVGSYAASLATKKSKAVRAKVMEHGRKFGLMLQPGETGASDWSLTTGGGVKASGTDGALTGFPGNCALVDDPHKNRKETESKVMRDNVWSWWSSTVLTRLSPGAPVILIQTRWHEDDLAGRLLRKEGRVEDGGRWHVVNLPAIATAADDPLGREVGDPLTHPLLEDDDREALAAHWQDKRRSVDARDWGALYQGDPKPREGALLRVEQVEHQRAFGIKVGRLRRAVSVDPSGGGKDTAGIVAGFLGDDQRVYITHDRTRVMPSTEWAREVCLLAYETEAQVIYVEKNYGGDLSIIPVAGAWDQLQREGRIPNSALKPWIEPKSARSGKYLRAEPIAQAWLEDRVRTYAYMPEMEDEWCIAAGEQVTTRRGLVPIEEVHAGDEAWTRQGWKEVLWAGCTGIRETLTIDTDAGSLRCTPNHRVFVEGKGFITALEVEPGDRIPTCLASPASRTSISTAGDTSNPLTATGKPTGPSAGDRTTGPCTEPSGPQPTVPSPTGTTLSTPTGTRPTTTLETSGSYAGPGTPKPLAVTSSANTRSSRESATTSSRTATTKPVEPAHGELGTTSCTEPSGPQPMAPSPTESTSTTSTKTGRATCYPTFAPWADTTTSSITRPSPQDGAPGIPRLGHRSGAKTGNGRSRATSPVTSAESSSSRLASGHASAHASAASVTTIVKHVLAEPVYDLTVADAHEFYANGMLVHNCTWVPGAADSPGRIDASVYLVYGLLQLPGSEQHIGSAAGVSLSQAAGTQAPGGLGGISLGRGR
jgi:hypothetical protein